MKRLSLCGLLCIGLELSFSAHAQSPSYAATQSAAPITPTSATLNGMAAPNGYDTVAWFEWGTNSGYGQVTSPVSLGNGFTVVPVSTTISNLPTLGVFQCRLVVSNSAGVLSAAPVQFTTGQRVTQWGVTSDGEMPIAAGLSNAVSASAGHFHSIALTADGRVVAWGNNSASQSTVPPGLGSVMAVSAGGFHNLVLRSDGTVMAWGQNDVGQTNVPPGLSNVVAISAGYNHSLALKADGTMAAWGNNSGGQATIPAGLSNVVAIAAGYYHNLALKSDGTVAAWGSYSTDQLQLPAGQTNVPAWLNNVVSVAAGTGHDLALRADGTVVAWGYNNLGQTNVPPGLSNVVGVAAGADFSLALRADGTVVGWGNPRSGQVSIPLSVSNAMAIAAGLGQGLAVRVDGSAAGWGANSFREALVPAGLGNVVAVSGGGYHSLALGNLPPIAQSQTNLGMAGRDLILTLPAADADYDALTCRVASLPTGGTLYQWSAGGRGAPITTPNTVVADVQERVIFAPDSDLPGWPYASFTFIANDGETDSAPATITVNLIPAPVIDLSSVAAGTNGGLSFNFTGYSNATYRVWASPDLTNWVMLGAAASSSPGWFSFTDPAATNSPQRFYRVTSP